ncbi:MAG: hypothetical protein RLT05_37120 [Bauldia litoralis]
MFVETRNSLIGTLRYFTWRPDASSYFHGTGAAFARSLLAYVLAFPFSMAIAYWDTDLQTRSRLDTFGWAVYVIEAIAGIAIVLGIAFLAARLMGRREHFFRYGAAANWQAFFATSIAFALFGIDEATSWFAREDAVGTAATALGVLVVTALLYWSWAILHQALKLRWWQSLPLALVLAVVSLIVASIARVTVKIGSAPTVG